jgi:putative intracellular protease/amidase
VQMKMAFILFDQMTTLDFVDFYKSVTRLGILKVKEDVSWDFCAMNEEVTDDRGMTIKVNRIIPDLSAYDLIFIPGGFATDIYYGVPQ